MPPAAGCLRWLDLPGSGKNDRCSGQKVVSVRGHSAFRTPQHTVLAVWFPDAQGCIFQYWTVSSGHSAVSGLQKQGKTKETAVLRFPRMVSVVVVGAQRPSVQVRCLSSSLLLYRLQNSTGFHAELCAMRATGRRQENSSGVLQANSFCLRFCAKNGGGRWVSK